MSFLKRVGRNLQSSVNAAFGKHVTKETEEFTNLLKQVTETKKNFKELQKLFDGLFARESCYGPNLFAMYPADASNPGKPFFQPCAAFYKEIKQVEDLIETFEQSRARYDEAVNNYNSKVSANKPGPEQEKFKATMEEAQLAYETARAPVLEGANRIIAARDQQHALCQQFMATLLQFRTATWAAIPATPAAGAAAEQPAAAAAQQPVVQQPAVQGLQYKCANCQTVHSVAPGTPKFVCTGCGVENLL